MTKIVLGTMLVVCAAVCAGFIAYRKRESKVEVLDSLKLNHIFTWIDEVLASIEKEEDAKFKVTILPNQESRELAKSNDKRIYVVVLQKELNGSTNVIKTKIFYAVSLDRALSDLESGILLEIPIKL